jgi:hypothetical protein
MKAPHAHVNNTKGNRKDFGKDKAHLKTYRSSKKNIYNRRMINITGELIHRPEFEEVRVLKKKLNEIKAET